MLSAEGEGRKGGGKLSKGDQVLLGQVVDAGPVACSTGRELITRATTSHKGFITLCE